MSKQGEIVVVCEVFRVPVSHADASVFEKKIREAIQERYPGVKVRGLWVHGGVGGAGDEAG